MSSTTNTTSLKERSLLKMGALLLAGGLIATACGSDTTTVADADTTTTTAAEAMDDDAMDDDAMDDDAMEDAMLGAFGPACDAVPTDGEGSFAGMADDPAATAATNNPLLSTLVSAVVEAELVDTLNSEGPFTIFAPTNDAFAKIDADTLTAVLADKALLTSILTYHVVGGQSALAADLGSAGTLGTVETGELTFGADGTMVNDANVICSNVPVANGTVHIIDSVLLPQVALDALAAGSDDAMDDAMLGASGPDCAAVPADGEGSFAGMADDPAATAATNNPLLSTLVSAVVQAELVDTLNSEGPFTIFAPTNDAFAKIDAATLEAVLADQALLTSILTNHVIPGQSLSADDLAAAGTLETVNQTDLTFDIDGQLMINGVATAGCQNVPVANGTVHIIDTVLLPEG